MSRRVLVTGGAGFIGSHMADRLLADGNEGVILDNESTGTRANVPAAAHYIAGDVRNPEDVARAFDGGQDAVFQIAGQATTILSFDNPQNDLSINVGGTLNILQACLEHQVPRLIYASSMICYGYPEQVPISEDHPCRPVSYYGITKYAAERLVLRYQQLWGLDVVCGPLRGWVERVGVDHHFVILDFDVTPLTVDEPDAGSDASAAEWVPFEALHTRDLVDGLFEFLVDHGVVEGGGPGSP